MNPPEEVEHDIVNILETYSQVKGRHLPDTEVGLLRAFLVWVQKEFPAVFGDLRYVPRVRGRE